MTMFRFNDELLLTPEDQELAKKRFPAVFFAFDHEELRADFQRIDIDANRAKSRSRLFGVSAIILAVISLLAFPLEPLIVSIQNGSTSGQSIFRIIAMVGAACGVLAVVLGNIGYGFGKLKRKWLQYRLMTERLRQWHAQYIIAHAKDICDAANSEEKRAQFVEERDISYRTFKRNVLEKIASEFTRLTSPSMVAHSASSPSPEGSKTAFWIEPQWADLAARKLETPASRELEDMFTAYSETRLLGQVQYTNYILSTEGKFWSLPARQLFVLGNTAFALVLLAFVANFVALTSAIWPDFPIGYSALGSIAISFAILAVGVRAMQEALHPSRELRRMQNYASQVTFASEQFTAARRPQQKIKAMCALERASFEEMLEFLYTNESARFVL